MFKSFNPPRICKLGHIEGERIHLILNRRDFRIGSKYSTKNILLVPTIKYCDFIEARFTSHGSKIHHVSERITEPCEINYLTIYYYGHDGRVYGHSLIIGYDLTWEMAKEIHDALYELRSTRYFHRIQNEMDEKNGLMDDIISTIKER